MAPRPEEDGMLEQYSFLRVMTSLAMVIGGSAGASAALPFGSFDTPAANATGITGAIAVTGWALDDSGLASVKLYRDPVGADPAGAIGANGKVYITDATFVAGARPDVASGYPLYPGSNQAGWGYMLLTNFLPSGSASVGG